jgi:hypothetical protein
MQELEIEHPEGDEEHFLWSLFCLPYYVIIQKILVIRIHAVRIGVITSDTLTVHG